MLAIIDLLTWFQAMLGRQTRAWSGSAPPASALSTLQPVAPRLMEREQAARQIGTFQQGILSRKTALLESDLRLLRLFDDNANQGTLPLSLPPASAMDVLHKLDDPTLSTAALAEAVRGDPALAGAVLRLANSAALRGVNPLVDLNQALIRMGRRQLKLLLLTSALNMTLIRGEPFQQLAELLWHHSLHCAQLCEWLAERVGCNGDFAYMTGLFHDVGTVAALNATRHMILQEKLAYSSRGVLEIMLKHGYYLNPRVVREWRLPEQVANAVMRFRAFQTAGDAALYGALAQVANDLCHHYGVWVERKDIIWRDHKGLDFLHLSPEQLPTREQVGGMAASISQCHTPCPGSQSQRVAPAA